MKLLRGQFPKLDTRLSQSNEIASSLGFKPFVLGKMYHREEMISTARTTLAKCRFDSMKCLKGLNCLSEFDASKRKTNSSSTMMTDVADSFMYLVMDAKIKKDKKSLHWRKDNAIKIRKLGWVRMTEILRFK